MSRAIADARAYLAQQTEMAADKAAKEFAETSGVVIKDDAEVSASEKPKVPRGIKGIFIFGFKKAESPAEKQVWCDLFTRGMDGDRLAVPKDVKEWAGIALAELKAVPVETPVSETEPIKDPLSA